MLILEDTSTPAGSEYNVSRSVREASVSECQYGVAVGLILVNCSVAHSRSGN